MMLVKPERRHLMEIMSWISSEQETVDWAGPDFRYPFDAGSFAEDLKLESLRSFSLVDRGEFLAFGQYYLRIGRCHLARLIVKPDARGRGIANRLLSLLCDEGTRVLEVEECSLFVKADNENAIKAYSGFGFVLAKYPEEMFLENSQYMIRSQGQLA
ncbi:MAG: hypothetical protein DHS20C12_16020 [Pseudohongiella sp.]|nr:MAG: hypothetical protein DHS20C12_16020 [Pseudohongiella sp.]